MLFSSVPNNKYFSENKIKLDRNELSEYFLSICKPYRDSIEETDDLKLKRNPDIFIENYIFI
jgi:hypothetical protein